MSVAHPKFPRLTRPSVPAFTNQGKKIPFYYLGKLLVCYIWYPWCCWSHQGGINTCMSTPRLLQPVLCRYCGSAPATHKPPILITQFILHCKQKLSRENLKGWRCCNEDGSWCARMNHIRVSTRNLLPGVNCEASVVKWDINRAQPRSFFFSFASSLLSNFLCRCSFQTHPCYRFESPGLWVCICFLLQNASFKANKLNIRQRQREKN